MSFTFIWYTKYEVKEPKSGFKMLQNVKSLKVDVNVEEILVEELRKRGHETMLCIIELFSFFYSVFVNGF